MNLQELLKDHYTGHSDFQIDYFITNKSSVTDFGMYKQALRELSVRTDNLKSLWFKQQENDLDISECKGKNFRSAREELKHKKLLLIRDGTKNSINNVYREFSRFYRQAVALKKRIGELTPEICDRLDKSTWIKQIQQTIILERIVNKRVSKSTLETIAALPRNDKLFLMKEMREGDDENKMIDWLAGTHDELLQEETNNIKLPQKEEILKLVQQ